MCLKINYFIYREGIKYSLQNRESSNQNNKDDDEPPANLKFLEVLGEFTFKLIPQDKTSATGV